MTSKYTKHLKEFDNYSEYYEFLQDTDLQWIPRVSLIINKGEEHTSPSKYNDNGPSWIDYSRIGDKFAQIANNGTLFLTDQPDKGQYASIDGSVLIITTNDKSQAYIDSSLLTLLTDEPDSERYPVPNTV